jgi:hypothetical protein
VVVKANYFIGAVAVIFIANNKPCIIIASAFAADIPPILKGFKISSCTSCRIHGECCLRDSKLCREPREDNILLEKEDYERLLRAVPPR